MAASRVVVTGASGFIAVQLVDALLQKGYRVHGTVRSFSNTEKLAPLQSLPKSKEKLKLFEADLVNPGSFSAAIQGTDGVFHTASPFFLSGVQTLDDAEARLIKPALDGTREVLKTCKSLGVRRVVLTSSTAAVAVRKDNVAAFDENTWSDVEYMRAAKVWYPLSKTLAERAAWDEFGRPGAGNLDLRVVNPCLVTGPLLTTHLNTSHEMILGYLNGSRTTIPNSTVPLVDVRDVVQTHVAAFENDAAAGHRHLCVSEVVHWEDICNILREITPSEEIRSRIPTKVAGSDEPGFVKAPKQVFKTDRVQHVLGINFISARESLKDTVASLIAMGHLQ
eukprot:ANDGO_03605.mRNA.1 Tetraketide alpha-pyrone reductase 1